MLPATYDIWAGHYDLSHVSENQVDRQVREFVIAFSKFDAAAREDIRRSLTHEDADGLLTFARRSAVLALQASETSYFMEGIAALAALDILRTDYRDILWALALLNHAGEQICADVKQASQYVTAVGDPKTAELIRSFFTRPRTEKDLRTAWGYDEVTTEHGAGFIGWGLLGAGRFEPTYDFKMLVLDVAEALANDRYQPTALSVASQVPAVWFRRRLSKVPLSRVRAAGTVHADLRPDYHPDPSQMLMVFLIESLSALGSIALARLLSRSPQHISLSVRYRELVAVVIASSSIHGVPLYETPRTLVRLAPALNTALQRARKIDTPLSRRRRL